ncbi:MAG: hypothetical protein AABX04_03620 [Nanoarchaeota archaeon]
MVKKSSESPQKLVNLTSLMIQNIYSPNPVGLELAMYTNLKRVLGEEYLVKMDLASPQEWKEEEITVKGGSLRATYEAEFSLQENREREERERETRKLNRRQRIKDMLFYGTTAIVGFASFYSIILGPRPITTCTQEVVPRETSLENIVQLMKPINPEVSEKSITIKKLHDSYGRDLGLKLATHCFVTYK